MYAYECMHVARSLKQTFLADTAGVAAGVASGVAAVDTVDVVAVDAASILPIISNLTSSGVVSKILPYFPNFFSATNCAFLSA